MPRNFWLLLAINEATTIAQAVVAVQGLTAPQKAALENLIAASDQVAIAFALTSTGLSLAPAPAAPSLVGAA